MKNAKLFVISFTIIITLIVMTNEIYAVDKATLNKRDKPYSKAKLYFNIPKMGLVQNKETAIKIAEAIWKNLYGDKINDKKPFQAELIKGKIWKVYGSLPEGWDGGVPYIEIRNSDCQILKVEFGK